MRRNNKYKTSFLLKLSFCFAILLTLFLLPKTSNMSLATNEDVYYLSDIPYDRTQSRSGYGSFFMDKAGNDTLISVKIEGGYYSFEKGIWAHARSVLVYDLTDYDYDYFTAYLGLNRTAASSSNGVIFKIYTSADGKIWNQKTNENLAVCKPGDNATKVKVSIKEEKFLKLEADSNGANGNDHSVYADAKLIKETYKEPGEDLVPSIKNLDNEIKEKIANNEEYELALYKRELINRVGNYALRIFLNENQENKDTYAWLTSDVDNIKLYIIGGTPEGGSYYNSLTQLSRLYNEYKDDFTLTEKLNNKWYPDMTYGDLYKKMAISLSLTHSQNVGLWMQAGAAENKSDALRRYAIYKYMHKNGKLKATESLDITPWFEALHVEEMRFVMNNLIDDEEILWLNTYVQDRLDQYKTTNWLTPHPYMAYVFPTYGAQLYYDEANKDYFNRLFAVSKKDDNKGEALTSGDNAGKVGLWDTKFTIPGGKNTKNYEISVTRGTSDYRLYKVWMNFRNKFGTGAVCGGISKSGSNIRATHGIPATVIGQPGHAALLCYSKNNDGKGYWGIDNDVSGWTLSEKGERLLLGWGNANTSYARGSYQVVYMVLAQEAINDFENLVKCEELVYLAKVYEGDLTKQEEIYNKALEKQPINIDAWLGLINVYNSNKNKTEEDYYNLAERLAENLKCFPLPMQHLTNLIKPKLTKAENIYRFTLLQTRILTQGSNLEGITTDDVLQPGVTRVEANFLLGKLDKTIATFSFDGEDAGKIVLSSRFDGNGVRWDYCLTGKGENENWKDANWKEVSFTETEEHKLQLTPEEISSITAENDIYIHVVGANYDEDNLYKIDITEQNLLNTLYPNDWENKVMGVDENTQWRYTESDNWTSFNVSSPDLTGNKTIRVRQAATGTKLASPASELYTFTQDNWQESRKYVPIEHLSIHSFSTQSTDSNRPYYAPNAIDGNKNTMWHTDFSQNVLQQQTKPFIAIELDEPRNISAIEFVQNKWRDSDPVYIKNAIIYVSNDGETWIEAGRKENCEQNLEFKSVEFESVYGKYIKFEMDTYNMFSSLAIVNVFEDKTKVTIANFSYNGENAGKIVLVDEFKGENWEYSLDNGITWKRGKGDSHALTEEELQQINADNDIKVRSNGRESTINIKEQEAPTISAYLNDLENRLIGISNIDNLEWKIEGNTNWISYSEEEPIVLGNKKLFIRKKAAGTLMPSDAVEFSFTEDNQPDTAKYVPIKHLSIDSFSSTTPNRGEPATNAIDALPTTMWHTNRTTTTMKDPRWIVIELDEPRYISKIEYVRKAAYAYGIPKNGTVSVSIDGENWEVATNIENLYNPTTVAELTSSENNKDITLAESKQAKYIKIECTESCDYVHGNRNGVPMDYFFSAAMFNIFEDITKRKTPTAEIEYNITELTNQNVTATLINESTEITVTNNEGSKTHTFTDNGEFTFEFVDKSGTRGTATAKVDWICKTLPIASIRYTPNALTNKDVTAEVTFDRDNVKILNETGEEIATIKEGNAYTYTFTDNGKHEIRFKGPYGNEGTTVAEVNWIDKIPPVASISYSADYKTNQPIIATIKFDKDDVIVEGGNTHTFTENGEYTFNYVDKAGNSGTATAIVTNIDKTLPVATINYDINELTNQNVIATVTFDKDDVIVEGGNTHTFTENGTYEFKFVGPAGNSGKAVAKVDWIDKKAPEATITYDINKLTNKDVTATIKFKEENVTITNNNGSNTYTFAQNGTFTFRFEDKAGNEGTATAEVEWIDKVQIGWTISYNINEITNKDVTATITFDKVGVRVVNDKDETIENGDKYVFTENGTHEFKFIGPAGNTGTAVAEVNWIDKIPPSAIINYDIAEPTNKDVTATVTFDEGGVTIVNDKGEPIENGDKHVFTKNGSYTFNYVGPLGNLGTAVAEVNWIDKTAPTAEVRYSTTNPTNQNVTVTLENASEEIRITNNNGSKTYTFAENGTFTFEFIDRVGNKGTAVATVNCIDKIAPTADIRYSTTNPTNQNVEATLINASEEIKITNNNGSKTYTFAKNGEFTFEFIDKAGNKGTAKAKVNWINKNNNEETIIGSEKYEIKDGYISGILPKTDKNVGTTVEEFKKNIKTDKEFTVVDKEGNTLAKDSIVTTGCKLIVSGTSEYTLIVKGDIDGDGEITINDLAKIKLHCIEIKMLTENEFKAANLDDDNEITINDLAILKLVLIGLRDIN